jgi:hypothetical protein
MLRPQYLQKNIVAFITLALVILYITAPTLAQRTNRKNSESSGSKQAMQQQAERERQQQAERERQRQAEQAKQQQAEREKQQQAERARQQAERERQQQAEQARQQQAERERQQQAERGRQQQAEREKQQAERERQQQAERERQRQAEQARQQQAERARQQQAERARQQQAERERQRQAEQARQQQAEREKQQQAERERQQAEREKQQQAERARQQAERERQQQAEQARQQQAERERQQQAEQARQQQAEQARQQQAERERQQQAERGRQQQAEREKQQAERERQQQQSERINRKQLIISPNDRDLDLRTDDEMSGRVNHKLPTLPNNTNTVVVDNSAPTVSPIYRYELSRPSHLVYRDRPYATDTYRREHIYTDYSSRICTKTITPSYRFILCYNRGPWNTFRYFYPYYHRKYVFVSLDGYWPFNYKFIRYYWYGYHPYYWCGYYPIASEVVGSSYNYYTYNYYYDDNPISNQPTSTLESQYYDNIYQQPAEEPVGATLADIYFEEAVKAFEESNYRLAIEKFAKAMELAPDDMILPFAYSQALFAAQQYTEATEVLRSALAKITSDKEGVFYPRGLYPKDEVLLAQLDMLTEKAELYKFDADLQLLLGYQLLGVGQLDKAVTPLQNASLDLVNTNAATILLGILERIKATEVQNEENVTNYPESVITAPETKGMETETNLMSEIKFDHTQASAIGPNVICWSFSVSFALMSLVSILCSWKSQLD